MAGWRGRLAALGAALSGLAVGTSVASARLGVIVIACVGGCLVLIAAIASFTWLRTLRHVRVLAGDDGRLPTIVRGLTWDFREPREPAVQGELFSLSNARGGRRTGRGQIG